MPWAPFERLTMTTADGTRTVDLPPGQEMSSLIADAMRDTVVDLADAITHKGAPAADGATALHTMETTIAAYASAALRHTVTVPLPAHGPLHNFGAAGLRSLDVPESALVRRRGLFGLTPAGA